MMSDVDGHDPDMAGLINRDADNWRPLFAIADLVGSDWPSRAREAALALTPKDSESIGPMLLGDIKAVFDDRSVDRLSSAEICTALCEMEGKPWADWKGKSLTANQLARLLKSFGVTSDSVRIGDRTPKGYYRHQFEEIWQRYLAPARGLGVYEAQHRNNTDEMGTSSAFQSATDEPDVAFQKCEKPPSNWHCCVVADQKGDTPASGVCAGTESSKCAQCGQDGAELEVAYVGRRSRCHFTEPVRAPGRLPRTTT